jgi:UDPglucose 6-dehydrogenase
MNNSTLGSSNTGFFTISQLNQLPSSFTSGQVTMSMPMPGTIGSATIGQLNNTFKIKLIKMKIGFIGLGFVGSAIHNVYKSNFSAETICVDPAKGHTSTYEDLLETDGVFVCVPSPQGEDGSCDTSILESVLEKLKGLGYHGVVISKCTAPPAVYTRLQEQYPNLVHAPEFLTAANAERDYMNSTFVIIGGKVAAYRNEAERIIKAGLHGMSLDVMHCTIAEASLAKYTINCFLSTKVVFMNEMHKLAEKLGCDYKKIAEMVKSDKRIGESHMQVPGPDGAFGFGGMCFPKDTSALLKYAEEAGAEMMVLNAAVRKNTFLRLTEPK